MTSKQAAWRVACARLVRLSTDMSNSGPRETRREHDLDAGRARLKHAVPGGLAMSSAAFTRLTVWRHEP